MERLKETQRGMAKYIAVRPRWNPRGVVVNYAMGGQLYVRSWPSHYRDAKSAQQQRQRGKMAQVCGALPYLKDLLAEGYTPRRKRNGRQIGSYHVAVSVALREWFADTPRGPQLALSRLQLTGGIAGLPRGLKVSREGGALRVMWGRQLGARKPKLLLAAREAGKNEWVSLPMPIEVGVAGAMVALPREWVGKEIETWVAFVGDYGRMRTTTRYDKLAPVAATVGATNTAAVASALGAQVVPPPAATTRVLRPASPSPVGAQHERGVVAMTTAELARKGPRSYRSPTAAPRCFGHAPVARSSLAGKRSAGGHGV